MTSRWGEPLNVPTVADLVRAGEPRRRQWAARLVAADSPAACPAQDNRPYYRGAAGTRWWRCESCGKVTHRLRPLPYRPVHA